MAVVKITLNESLVYSRLFHLLRMFSCLFYKVLCFDGKVALMFGTGQ